MAIFNLVGGAVTVPEGLHLVNEVAYTVIAERGTVTSVYKTDLTHGTKKLWPSNADASLVEIEMKALARTIKK